MKRIRKGRKVAILRTGRSLSVFPQPCQQQKSLLPHRTCMSCRTQRDKQDLVRFVCTPDGQIVLDVSRYAPGRGVYLCYDRQCIQRGLQVAKLAQAWKRPVHAVDLQVVYHAIGQLLQTRVHTCFHLGQKAGVLLSGYARLRQAFAQARVCYAILAEDSAPERAAEYRAWCLQYQVPSVTLFTKAELGQLLGKATSRSAVGWTAPHLLTLLRPRLSALEHWHMASQKA